MKLLESAIGASLFVRDNNKLELTALGAELLTITRNMMRQVDDCLAREEARRGASTATAVACPACAYCASTRPS